MKLSLMAAQLKRDLLIGGTHALTLGTEYWVISGSWNSRYRGKFTASAADVTAFNAATMTASVGPFGNRVTAVAELPYSNEEHYTSPQAYIVPVETSGDEPKTVEGYYQDNTTRFAVVAVIDNSIDSSGTRTERRGAISADEISDIRLAIASRLVNWIPTGARRQIHFLRDHPLEANQKYLFWYFEFDVAWEWSHEAETWAPGPFDDLEEINVNYNLDEYEDVLTGGTDLLTEGARYYILSGTINTKTQGPFVASAADVADFTVSTQTVRLVTANDEVDMTGV